MPQRSPPLRVLLLLVVACLAAPAAARAQDDQDEDDSDSALVGEDPTPEPVKQIHAWVDARGQWHFVDTLALVPPRYRSQARANAITVEAVKVPDKDRSTATVVRRELSREEIDAKEAQTRRPPPTGEDEDARRKRLETRRDELLEQVARLEEGYDPNDDAVEGQAAPSVSELEAQLTAAERELDDIEAWLARPRRR